MKMSRPQLVTAIVMFIRDQRKQAMQGNAEPLTVTKWSSDVEAVNLELNATHPPIESVEDYKQYLAWKDYYMIFNKKFGTCLPHIVNWKDHGIKYWERETKSLIK